MTKAMGKRHMTSECGNILKMSTRRDQKKKLTKTWYNHRA